MNVTLTHLFLINIYKYSPAFTSSINFQSSSSYFQIEKSFFKYFFSSLYYSSFIQPNKRFLSSKTLFQQFLTSSLYFDKNYFYNNETIESRRLSFIIGPINISMCIFRLCISGTKINFDSIHNKGGAIFCLTNLSIHQCLFEHNSATRGGSIYCSGELTLKSVTFEGGFSEEGQGFVNENCPSMPLFIELCLFVNLESVKHTCFTRTSSGSVSVFSNNISTNSAKKENAGFYLSDRIKLNMKASILFELVALCDTSILMINCGKSKIDRTIFWYLKSSISKKIGSTCLSFYDTKSVCTIKDCSFLICSPGNTKLISTRGGAKVIISGACSTGDRADFYQNERDKKEKKNNKLTDSNSFNSESDSDLDTIIDKKSRFNEQCQDRYIVYVSQPFGYYIKNDEIELATKKTDIYDGFIIGALGLIIISISSIISFTLLYQITLNCF